MSTLYSLTFEVASFTDEQLDHIEQTFDVIASEGHGPTEVTAILEADSPLAAAQAARRAIGGAGVTIRRYLPDLVTRTDIAERAGITTQAVGNYVRGSRGSDFPAPYFDVASGAWLWGEVLPWLRAQGLRVEDPCSYLGRRDTEAVMNRIWSDAKVDGGWEELRDVRIGILRSAPIERKAWTGTAYSVHAPKFGLVGAAS